MAKESFKEKYTTDKTAEPNKILISAEAFAVSELLEEIINNIKSLNNILSR